jgi:hypothetical protein
LLTAKPGTKVVILGGAHDLADNIRRLAPDTEYVVVTTRRFREAAKPQSE